jgi:hypothetical protein
LPHFLGCSHAGRLFLAAQFEREFEEMRKARHKKPEAAAADGELPSKKHDEDGIWDTNLSFEESSTTTTITTGGQVNRRTVTSTVTGLRPPPGFGNGAPGNGPLAGPVTPRTPRASDGDWRINKRTVIEETVEPAKEKTPATSAADSNAVKGGGGGAAQKSEGTNEGGHGKAPGGPSLLDSIFASGEKGARETKEEGGGAKTGESLVLKNLFKNAHRKVFPGLDDDPVSSLHKCTGVGVFSCRGYNLPRAMLKMTLETGPQTASIHYAALLVALSTALSALCYGRKI